MKCASDRPLLYMWIHVLQIWRLCSEETPLLVAATIFMVGFRE